MKRIGHHGHSYKFQYSKDAWLDFDKTFADLGWNPQLRYGDHVEFFVHRGRDLRAQFWTALLRQGIYSLNVLGSWSVRVFLTLRRAQENRRAVRQLMMLSDYGLKDMGVARSEVAAVVSGIVRQHGRG